MIYGTDLMIGNYVRFPDGEVRKVDGIQFISGSYITDEYGDDFVQDEIDPVKITPDFLLYNGFERKAHSEKYSKNVDNYEIAVWLEENGYRCTIVPEAVVNSSAINLASNNCEYIHQLQNILTAYQFNFKLIYKNEAN